MQKVFVGESMVPSVRPVWAAIAAASVLFLAAFSSAVLTGFAQSAPAPTAAQAAAFVGDWVAAVAMGGNQSTSLVSIKNDGGKVSASVTPEGQAPITRTQVAMAGTNLVVRYTLDFQGQAINTVLTLTPDTTAGPLGNVMRVNMAVMDGQYEMAGMAAKQVPG